MQQALERLQQANDDMRRAASPGAERRRRAPRRRATPRSLRPAQRLAGAGRFPTAGFAGPRGRALERRAARPGGAHAAGVRSLASGQALGHRASPKPRSDELEKLAGDRQRLAGDLAGLEKQMQDATRSLASGQRAAASKLRDALAGMDQSDLQAKLQRSAEMIRRGMDPNANPSEATINSGIERLNDQLREARQSLGNGQQNPDEALDRMARLRSQIDTLREIPAVARTKQAPSGKLGDRRAGRQSAGQRDRAAAGNLRNGVAGGNANGGRWDGERFFGGYDPAVLQGRKARSAKPEPITQADIERAYQEALHDLNALRQTVRGDPGRSATSRNCSARSTTWTLAASPATRLCLISFTPRC